MDKTSEEDSGSGQSTIVNTRHPFFATQPSIRTWANGTRARGASRSLRKYLPMELVATYNDPFGVTKGDLEFFDFIVEILRRRKKR